MARNNDRRQQFKKTVDSEAGRRRRDETTLQLRKQKKSEQIAKRRAAATDDIISTGNKNNSNVEESNRQPPTLAEVPALIRIMRNPNSAPQDRLDATRGVRRMLSVENPPAMELIDMGVLPIMVGFLNVNAEPTLQFEAAWALTNVASTDFTAKVVEAGALPGLVRMLERPEANVREQAVWCLGNIAGDCVELRDFVLQAGALNSILRNVENPENASLLRNMVWAISNLCRGNSKPDFAIVRDCIPAMVYAMAHQMSSTGARVDALWALSYLSDGDDYRIQAIVECDGVISNVMTALTSGKSSMMAPALRILGNIVTGNAEQTQAVLDAGILTLAPKLLENPKSSIRKETAWLLSNIAAGNEHQVAALFKKANLVPTLVHMSRSSAWIVRKEAIWCISNICSSSAATPKQIQALVDLDAIEAMAEVLDMTDATIVLVALDAIENILKFGKARGKIYQVYFLEADGVTKLENLQHHTNDAVYNKSIEIIETYYGVEEDEGDENLIPEATADGFFAFGIQSSSPSPKVLFGSSSSPATNATSPGFPRFDFGNSPSAAANTGASPGFPRFNPHA